MSSIGFNPQSVMSQYSNPDDYYQQNYHKEDDDAQFFSIANEYNERKRKITDFRAMQAMNMVHNFNIKNNPKELFKSDEPKQKVRKTRSDQEGRQFICGACKSGYLSYPALYTHIKTKHNGVAPEGTIRGKNNNNKKRGRPKSKRKQPQFHYDKQPQNLFPKEYMDLVPKSGISNAFEEQQDDDIEQKGQITIPMFVKEIKQLRKSTQKLCTLSLIKILTIYLHNIKFFLRLQVFETIEMLSSKLIKQINEHYLQILTDYQNQSKFYIRKTLPPPPPKSKHQTNPVQLLYCEYEKCQYFPVFAHYILKRLDPEDDQIQCDFLIDFCSWLYDKKLTPIKIVKSNMLEAVLVEEDEEQ